MKIVTVLTSEAQGGAEFAAIAMLDALETRGHDTLALTDQPALADGFPVAASLIDLGPKLSSRSWKSSALRWPLWLRRMRQALDGQAPYDVLIVHFKKEQLLASLLPRRLRARLAWMEWGPVPPQMRSGLARRLLVAASRRAAVVMAISEGTRESLVAAGIAPDRIVVIPNAVRADEIRFDPDGRARVRAQLNIEPDDFVVGCVSRLHPLKRNDVVVDAVAELGDSVHLVMAGEGETEEALRERARERGVRAHFMPTPRDDVAAVLSAFDVSVFCPSPTEGAPRAVIIAMLAGRPCVSTAREGVVDLIEQSTGIIVEPDNDVSALADALRLYRDDPVRLARDGERARARATERFDAPIVGALLERTLAG